MALAKFENRLTNTFFEIDFMLKEKIRPLFFGSHLVHEIALLLGSTKKWSVFYTALRWLLLGLFRSKTIVKTQQGVFAVSTRDSAIARQLYCDGEFELGMMRKLPEILMGLGYIKQPKLETIIDVGANVGIISIGMLNLGIAERAVAVEPEPKNFGLLEENIKLNRLSGKVVPLNCAVSDSAKKLEFEMSVVNSGDHRVRASGTTGEALERCAESRREVIVVQAYTLDDIFEKLPAEYQGDGGVVWIDVQGHEGYVYSGGQRFFRSGVATVAEFWPYGIIRSGMTLTEYIQVAASIWDGFFDLKDSSSRLRSINELNTLFDELGTRGGHTNILFHRSSPSE